MSVQHQERKFYTLKEIAQSIQNALKDKTEVSFWATAEIVKLGYYPQSGHCYPQLVQKENGKVIAEMRGLMWKFDFIKINNKFRKVTGSGLQDGITVFFQCHLRYDALYGLSLQILDIDPVYTLGEMEQERLQCIKRLTKENLYTLNRQLPSHFLVKKLAVISVDTSKGYHDFTNIIEGYKEKGLRLDHKLFPSLLHVNKSPLSIMNQIKRIQEEGGFDAVAIIRGGGGDVGLASYNDYELAKSVATYFIPVYAGIGHSTNETVTELVSHRYFITPTDLATHFMEKYDALSRQVTHAKHTSEASVTALLVEELRTLHSYRQQLSSWSTMQLSHERTRLQNLLHSLHMSTKNKLSSHMEKLVAMKDSITEETEHILDTSKMEIQEATVGLTLNAQKPIHLSQSQLDVFQKTIEILDPQKLLDRGFSMTYQEGKILDSVEKYKKDKTIIIRLKDGEIKSTKNEISEKF